MFIQNDNELYTAANTILICLIHKLGTYSKSMFCFDNTRLFVLTSLNLGSNQHFMLKLFYDLNKSNWLCCLYTYNPKNVFN